MRKIAVFLVLSTVSFLLFSCGGKPTPSFVHLECEGEFSIVSYVRSKGECYPKVEIISNEGAVVEHTRVSVLLDTINPGYETRIIASLKDPCSDGVVDYRVICGKDTINHSDTIRSLGFQATGPRKTTYNRQTGYFEYDLEFGCCPNAPTGPYKVEAVGYSKVDFLKTTPDQITCPSSGGPQTIHVSGFTRDTAYTSVYVTFKGPRSECSIRTFVK